MRYINTVILNLAGCTVETSCQEGGLINTSTCPPLTQHCFHFALKAAKRSLTRHQSKASKPGEKTFPAEEEVDVKNLIVEVRATSQVWKLCRLDSALIIQNSISYSLLLAFRFQNNED